MKWADALQQFDKPTWTNRDASGIVSFARAVFRTYSKDPNVSLSPWDWYPFALPALGWSKPGDKFVMTTTHQLQPYAFTTQLRAAVAKMAGELDAAGIAAKMLADPRGTAAGYKQLALDAWEAMKQLGQEGSRLPGDVIELWASHVGPAAAAAVASSASEASAAAAKPPGAKPTPPKEAPQTPSEATAAPAKEATEYQAQPVEPSVSKKNGGGGGAVVVLALLALGSGGKRRRRGRR